MSIPRETKENSTKSQFEDVVETAFRGETPHHLRQGQINPVKLSREANWVYFMIRKPPIFSRFASISTGMREWKKGNKDTNATRTCNLTVKGNRSMKVRNLDLMFENHKFIYFPVSRWRFDVWSPSSLKLLEWSCWFLQYRRQPVCKQLSGAWLGGMSQRACQPDKNLEIQALETQIQAQLDEFAQAVDVEVGGLVWGEAKRGWWAISLEWTCNFSAF